jgi:hypothetical protein
MTPHASYTCERSLPNQVAPAETLGSDGMGQEAWGRLRVGAKHPLTVRQPMFPGLSINAREQSDCCYVHVATGL